MALLPSLVGLTSLLTSLCWWWLMESRQREANHLPTDKDFLRRAYQSVFIALKQALHNDGGGISFSDNWKLVDVAVQS